MLNLLTQEPPKAFFKKDKKQDCRPLLLGPPFLSQSYVSMQPACVTEHDISEHHTPRQFRDFPTTLGRMLWIPLKEPPAFLFPTLLFPSNLGQLTGTCQLLPRLLWGNSIWPHQGIGGYKIPCVDSQCLSEKAHSVHCSDRISSHDVGKGHSPRSRASSVSLSPLDPCGSGSHRGPGSRQQMLLSPDYPGE